MKKLFKKLKNGIKTFVIAVLVITVLVISAAGIWFYSKYGKQILSLQDKAKKIAKDITREDFKTSQTSLVYAKDGTLIASLKAEKDVYYLDYEEIPQTVIDTVIVTEDRKFFEHYGIDIFANIRASILLIKNKGEIHQGGSTITQQLARNIFLTNDVTWERKITEIFLAAELEKIFSKEDILEFYLNNIYYANGHYGIQAAAYGYFGKSVKELNLSETVFLCAIPNNPTLYDPLVNFDSAVMHRDKCLLQLYEQGYIDEQEYNSALAYKIELTSSQSMHNDYVESYTYYCAVRALMQADGFVIRNSFSSDEDRAGYYDEYYELYNMYMSRLYTGGYRIYTSIDLEKQEMLMNSVSEALAGFTELNDEGIYKIQGAAVCIDNETGHVTAIAGGRRQELAGYTLNRGYQAYRQPGSAVKPLIVYTPSFERGMYPDDIITDEKFLEGPRNSGGVYSGEITVRYAVEVSKNTVAWKLFEKLTPQTGLSYLLNMGFSKIVASDYVPAASLGGMTYGASPVEMASAYAAIENEGIYRTPDCIVRITDPDGEIITDDTNRKEVRVYSKNAALMMTDVLKGVMTNGTGRKLNLTGMTCAGKTGTTMNGRDGWFCGFTRYYTTAVWVGADIPEKIENLAGNTYPGYIWQDFMQKLHEGLEDMDFEPYIDNREPENNEETENNGSGENAEITEGETAEGEMTENGETQGEAAEGEMTENGETQGEYSSGTDKYTQDNENIQNKDDNNEQDFEAGEINENIHNETVYDDEDDNTYYESWWYEEGWDEYYNSLKQHKNIDGE